MIEVFIWTVVIFLFLLSLFSVAVFLTVFMVEKELDQFDEEN